MRDPKSATTGEVRLSYVNVFKPQIRPGQTEAKYSVTVLVPKTDVKTKADIDAAVAHAIDDGVSRRWGGVRPPQPAICIHDGDGPRPSDGQPYGAECKGCWVFTASNKNPPRVVDATRQNIIDEREVYSGIWGRVNVKFFAYNSNGKKGIGCTLNHVQKLRDGEPLVDRISVEEAFGDPLPPAQPATQARDTGSAGYQVDPITGLPCGAQPAAQSWNSGSPSYPVDPITGLPYGA